MTDSYWWCWASQGLQHEISTSLKAKISGGLTLIHLLTLPIGRVRVSSGIPIALLVHLVNASRVLHWSLALGRRVADGRKVWTNAGRIVGAGWCLCGICGLTIDTISPSDGTLTFLVCFASSLFLLLAGLPLFANLLELYNSVKLAK